MKYKKLYDKIKNIEDEHIQQLLFMINNHNLDEHSLKHLFHKYKNDYQGNNNSKVILKLIVNKYKIIKLTKNIEKIHQNLTNSTSTLDNTNSKNSLSNTENIHNVIPNQKNNQNNSNLEKIKKHEPYTTVLTNNNNTILSPRSTLNDNREKIINKSTEYAVLPLDPYLPGFAYESNLGSV